MRIATLACICLMALVCATARSAAPQPLAGTQPLTWDGDIASRLVDAADRFLLSEIDKSQDRRARHWNRDFSSAEAYSKSIRPNRDALAHIIGVRDARIPFSAPHLVATTTQPATIAQTDSYQVQAIRFPTIGDVQAEALMLSPTGRKPIADIIAVPDADQTPEQLAGLAEGIPAESQFARRLAESGCRVIVPALVSRRMEKRGNATLTNREFLYRPAFEMGRHIIGYEVQTILALVDWLSAAGDSSSRKIGLIGYGEGGGLALYAAALDIRISAACISGYLDDRRTLWQQPIDRNIFGLLDQFGDAELASMVCPRPLVIEVCHGPELTLPGKGGAPARLETPKLERVRSQLDRARSLTQKLQPSIQLITSNNGTGPFATTDALKGLLASLSSNAQLAPSTPPARHLIAPVDPLARESRLIHQFDRHTQSLLIPAAKVRTQFMSKLDTSSLAAYQESQEHYRQFFYDKVIGRFDYPLLPPNPRTRPIPSSGRWTGYEVVLDVFEDVFAYGILLLPNDIKPGEKRPVVVCQHGLEGRPQQLISGDNPAYHDYASRLADRGYVVFAPQNLYLFGDRFRTLQRKANPLGKTLFSIITPQHQQIINFLKTLPAVDPQRIAFYGLSYGGKTAMRVPALLTDYCLSICSADFNDWVWKNVSTSSPYSYVWMNEYEIFEFDLGSTFNYAEMAALIAPRPFMVERGHFDGVAPDEAVAAEFAKVRFLYAAKLKIPDRCAIEFFAGPHMINAKGTFEFLDRHLPAK